MRYGFYLPTRGPTATRDGILALARQGERLGLHSAMIADHIVPGRKPVALPIHAGWQAPERGRRAGDLLHLGGGGRRDGR
jgi:alkanesulfonate monooxygenase SsuD/methylene tetrahydromethanopterin reductase-like flavin-dependent oxidoreductase (luciferase family)